MMNVTLTNLTQKQKDWLMKEAKKRGTTITGLIKICIETGMVRDKQHTSGDEEYVAGDGFWG